MSVNARPNGAINIYSSDANKRLLAGTTYHITFEYETSGEQYTNNNNLVVQYRTISTDELVTLVLEDDYLVWTTSRHIDADEEIHSTIESHLGIFGTVKLLKTFEDAQYLIITRNITNSQDVNFYDEVVTMQDVGFALDKRTMVSQDQGQNSGYFRMPIDKVIVNNINGNIQVDYEENCLLGVKDDKSKVVPIYPDGVTTYFYDEVDEEGNKTGRRLLKCETSGSDDGKTIDFYVDIVGRGIAVASDDIEVIDDKTGELLARGKRFYLMPLVQTGEMISMAFNDVTPNASNETPTSNDATPNGDDDEDDEGDTPAPAPSPAPDDDFKQAVLYLNAAKVSAGDATIRVVPIRDENNKIIDQKINVDIDEVSRHITINPQDKETINRYIQQYISENINNLIPEQLLKYKAGTHISFTEETFAWRTTVVEAIRAVLPSIIGSVPQEVLETIGLSPELLNLLIQGQVSEFSANVIIQIAKVLLRDYIYSALPSAIRMLLPSELDELVDDVKVYRINCTLEAGRNIDIRGEKIDCLLTGGDLVEVDDETHKINCTVKSGKDIQVDQSTGEVNSKLDFDTDYLRYRAIDNTVHNTLRPGKNVRFIPNVQDGVTNHNVTAAELGIAEGAQGILGVKYKVNDSDDEVTAEVAQAAIANGGFIREELIDILNLDGLRGEDGVSPHVGSNGNWYVGETDTGIKAQGPKGDPGEDGVSPHVGSNGNWYVGETDTGIKAQGPKGDPGEDGANATPEEIQTIVKTFLETPQNPVTVNVKNIVEEVSNDKTSNTLKPVLYNEGPNITITGGVTKGAGGSTTEGDSFLTTIINGIKTYLPIITAIGSAVSPEVAAAIALIDGLTQEQKDQATTGNIENWGVELVLKLIPALTQFLPSWLQSLIPGNKQQLDNNVNGETYVYTINGRTYTFICPDNSIDITRTDNGKISSQVSLKVSEALKDSLRGRDGQDGKDGKDGKDYFSVRDLPQIVVNLSATGGAGVFPIAENTIVGAGGSVTTTGVGEPVNNSPMVPVPSEVIVKSMPTYDVDGDADVIGIKKYTGSATYAGKAISYIAVSKQCELLLGIENEDTVRLTWEKFSIVPSTYSSETQPQVGYFSYSGTTDNLLIVCSNVNYVFGVHIGSTFETLTYTIFDTTTYCPSPYGANGGECCAWSETTQSFYVAPSNNDTTGNLLIIATSSTSPFFMLGTDEIFSRTNTPGSIDFVRCDFMRSTTTTTATTTVSDVLMCVSSSGYIFRRRYVGSETFSHSVNIASQISSGNVKNIEILGAVSTFSGETNDERWHQIVLFRHQTTSNPTTWQYKQIVFFYTTSLVVKALPATPSRIVGDCVRISSDGEVGGFYDVDGKNWWYTLYNHRLGSYGYINALACDGQYNTKDIAGGNIQGYVYQEIAIDNSQYWAFNSTSNSWTRYAFYTDKYQYQIVRSLYTFDGYLSALANVTVNNTLLQFFMWTQDGGDTWNFKTLNDGTDGEYIDCIYGSAGVLFIPKRWETYAILQSLSGNIEKKTVEDIYEYTAGGFVIKSNGAETYCVFCCDEENFKDVFPVIVTTSTPGTPSSFPGDNEHFNADGLDGIDNPTEALNNHSYFVTGMIPSAEGQKITNVMAGVMPSLGNGFVFWDEDYGFVSPVVLNGMEPIGAPVFDENGLALLVKKSNGYSIIYYSLPNNEFYFDRDDFLRNRQEFSIYAPSSFVPAYKPEQLMYNRLTGLWTLFYRRQPNYQNDKNPLIVYTASTLAELATGARSALWETEDIKVDTLVYNQYGFCSFGGGKVMLSASPKNIFDLLSFLNYTTKKQRDELDHLRQTVIEYNDLFATKTQLEDYVPTTTTINDKALSSNVTLTASDVGALASDGTAAKATADASGNTITTTYATKTALNEEASKRLMATSSSGGMVEAYIMSHKRAAFGLKYLMDCVEAILSSNTSTAQQNLTLAKNMVWNTSELSSLIYSNANKPQNNRDDS